MNNPFLEVKLVPCVGKRKGWVYFIACTDTKRCKIGFTKGDPEKRLKALQTGSAGKLTLIAQHPGTPESESILHARFASQCVHGEWFEMSEELLAYISATVWAMASICSKKGITAPQWAVLGLRMIKDMTGGAKLPKELEAMV